MITLVPLSGFLGSGKTTTLIRAAIALQRIGRRVAVVTNDPGAGLVDTALARGGLGEVVELAGGCLCHRLPELTALLDQSAAAANAEVILVEAAGNCAHLRAAVIDPLRERYRDRVAVAPLTAVVDPLRLAAFTRASERCEPEPDLGYLFGRQLAEAELLAINKTDLIGEERTAKLDARLSADYPHATVLPYSAAAGVGLDALVGMWTRAGRDGYQDTGSAQRGNRSNSTSNTRTRQSSGQQAASAARRGGDADLARCGDAEAQLAWLNEAFRVTAPDCEFDALAWGAAVLRHLSRWSATTGYFVGHLKLAVRTPAGLAKLSVTESGLPPHCDRAPARPVEHGHATINARVACPTSVLDDAVREAIAAADEAHQATSHGVRPASFRTAHRTQPAPRLAATG